MALERPIFWKPFPFWLLDEACEARLFKRCAAQMPITGALLQRFLTGSTRLFSGLEQTFPKTAGVHFNLMAPQFGLRQKLLKSSPAFG